MTPGEEKESTKGKTRIYLILGTIFLAAAGLFSSLDSVFLWVNLLAGAFCYLVAYSRFPKAQVASKQRHQHTSQSRSAQTIFNTDAQANSRRIVIFASVFIFGVFFVITFMAILFSGDSMVDDIISSEKAENFRLNGEYDSALVYYRRAINEDPDNLDAVIGYGNSHLGKQQYDSAFYYYDKVMETDPTHVYASYNKSLARYNQQSYDRAIEEGKKTLAIDPTYHSADVIIADSYYAQVNYDSALRYYTNAYDNDIRSPWICHVLGYLHQQKGNTDQAIALYQEAISYDSTMTEVYERLGELIPGEEGAYYRQRGAQSQ
jgi:tetratricopeptide (TPR) repeat protein